MQFPILKTDRVTLRQLTGSDDMAISILRSDEAINKYLDREKTTTIEAAKAFILKINDNIKQQKSFYWAICLKDDPNLIGTICLWNFSKNRTSAEVGYELHTKYHGQGLMDESLKCVIAYGFGTMKFKTLEAFTYKNNDSFIRLLEKNNFKPDHSRHDKENLDHLIYILSNPAFLS